MPPRPAGPSVTRVVFPVTGERYSKAKLFAPVGEIRARSPRTVASRSTVSRSSDPAEAMARSVRASPVSLGKVYLRRIPEATPENTFTVSDSSFGAKE